MRQLSTLSTSLKLASTGKIKLNTDGSSKGNPGIGGFGGVFRNDEGRWLLDFYGHLEKCTALEAEIKAILMGLLIAKEKEFREMEIESNSSVAVLLIKEECSAHHPLLALISDCQMLIQEGKHTLSQCYCRWVSKIRGIDSSSFEYY